MVEATNALDDVKGLGVRLAAVTKPSLIVKARGVDTETKPELLH